MNPLNPPGAPEIAWPALAAIVLLTAAATLIHWWLRSRGLLPTSTNPIKLIATRSLGGKRSVAIVEVDDQRLLLGMTDEVVTLLSPLASEAKPIAISGVAARVVR